MPEQEPQSSTAQRAAAEAKKTEGNAAFKAKRYTQAIGFYTEAARLDPTCAVYYCNRSTCYANLGDWKGASRADASPALKNLHSQLHKHLHSIHHAAAMAAGRREERSDAGIGDHVHGNALRIHTRPIHGS